MAWPACEAMRILGLAKAQVARASGNDRLVDIIAEARAATGAPRWRLPVPPPPCLHCIVCGRRVSMNWAAVTVGRSAGEGHHQCDQVPTLTAPTVPRASASAAPLTDVSYYAQVALCRGLLNWHLTVIMTPPPDATGARRAAAGSSARKQAGRR